MSLTITVRGVPTETHNKFRELAAQKTQEVKGQRRVTINEMYVEALNRYVRRNNGPDK